MGFKFVSSGIKTDKEAAKKLLPGRVDAITVE